MSAEVKTYEITSEMRYGHGSKFARCWRLWLFYFVVFVIVSVPVDRMIFGKWEPVKSLFIGAFSVVFMAIVMPLILHTEQSSLMVSDDFVELTSTLTFKTLTKRISRNKVTDVKEMTFGGGLLGPARRGLAVRDRGWFGARFWGFVFIPAELPDYEEIKRRLLQWTPV